jgi:hypothetical protein
MEFQDFFDVREKIDLGQGTECPALSGNGEEAETMTVLVPVSDLFGAGVFEVIRQSRLSGAGCRAGKDVAAGEGHAALVVFGAWRNGETDDAGATDAVRNV